MDWVPSVELRKLPFDYVFVSAQDTLRLEIELLKWRGMMGWREVEMFQLRSGVNPSVELRKLPFDYVFVSAQDASHLEIELLRWRGMMGWQEVEMFQLRGGQNA